MSSLPPPPHLVAHTPNEHNGIVTINGCDSYHMRKRGYRVFFLMNIIKIKISRGNMRLDRVGKEKESRSQVQLVRQA